MVITGLERLLAKTPPELKRKRIGILCHAPSATSDLKHITEHFYSSREFILSAVFGPQHGLFGETQDNMIEWSGHIHPEYKIPVFSLYGEHRKPAPSMLGLIDALVIDLQDVGARLYTYAWTIKLCMEACSEAGIPVFLLDRPNPIAAIDFDGPVLSEEYFTFVGGACIPLCHRMTLGEIALWIKGKYIPECDLRIIAMGNWKRSMMYNETGLPWILPSPNMPTLQTAIVYPGMVLFETLNLSEGRGTTIPFELFGAPYTDPYKLLFNLRERNIPGCSFRIHNFIPTFNKFAGQHCNGLQVHATDYKLLRPVAAAAEIIEAVIQTSPPSALRFNDPPYEYEYRLIPFDILAGDDGLRKTLLSGGSLKAEYARWSDQTEKFKTDFKDISLYSEK